MENTTIAYATNDCSSESDCTNQESFSDLLGKDSVSDILGNDPICGETSHTSPRLVQK